MDFFIETRRITSSKFILPMYLIDKQMAWMTYITKQLFINRRHRMMVAVCCESTEVDILDHLYYSIHIVLSVKSECSSFTFVSLLLYSRGESQIRRLELISFVDGNSLHNNMIIGYHY